MTALVAGGLVTTAAPAAAATFTVTLTTDPAPNGCAVDGCSLREAIIDANSNANPAQQDTINFQTGPTILLTRGSETEGPTGVEQDAGDLDVTQSVLIDGSSQTVDASGLMSGDLATPDRVFHVTTPGGTQTMVTIEDLGLRGGETEGLGGGISNVGSSVVLTRTVVFQNNADGGGGGVYAGAAVTTTTVLNNSIVTDNFTASGDPSHGGGIYNGSGDTLTVQMSEVSGNQAESNGGGIYNLGHTEILGSLVGTTDPQDFGGSNSAEGEGGGVWTAGSDTLIVDGSAISGNFAGADGGGIYNVGDRVEITDSSVSGNVAGMSCVECAGVGGNGGGIWTRGFFDESADSPGLFIDEESSVANNRAVASCGEFCVGGNGGGIYNEGHAEIAGGTDVDSNLAQLQGGGIWTGSAIRTLILVETTVSNNDAGTSGGGIYNDGDTVEIRQSAIFGNTAHNGTGGGIWTRGQGFDAENVTISGNDAQADDEEPADGAGRGGGAYLSEGILDFHSLTVTDNSADVEGGNIATQGPPNDQVHLTNTIISEGTPDNCSISPDDAVFSFGYNLSDDGDDGEDLGTCLLDHATDLRGVDPLLAPLALNPPGLTETHALNAGSPAIDSGPPTGQQQGAACLETDQRGVSRPQDGDGNGTAICDRGAYERESARVGGGGGGGAPPSPPGPTTQTRICEILGTAGNDILIGNAGDNEICGLDGDDLLRGAAGNDLMLGEGGDDVLDGGPGDDLLDGGPGSDTGDYSGAPGSVDADLTRGTAVGVGASTDTLVAIDNLIGSEFRDVLRGNNGANELVGRKGRDRLVGRGGNDILRGNRGRDRGKGSGGDDQVRGGFGRDRLKGGGGEDFVTGGGRSDRVIGNEGDDGLRGGGGDDVLNGKTGTDSCTGGAGVNTLVGCEL